MFLELVQSLKTAGLTAKDGSPFLFPRSLIKVMVINEDKSDLLLTLRDTVRVSAAIEVAGEEGVGGGVRACVCVCVCVQRDMFPSPWVRVGCQGDGVHLYSLVGSMQVRGGVA